MEDDDLPPERHFFAAGGADVYEPGEYEVLPPDRVDLRPAKAQPLPPGLASEVLGPLCSDNLARYMSDAEGSSRGLSSIAWSHLHSRGYKLFVCFVRGPAGGEELVVVLPEGSVSWPIRQLVPEASAFLEVQAL